MTRLAELRALLAKATPGPWGTEKTWGSDPADEWFKIGPMSGVVTSEGSLGASAGIEARPEDAALVCAAVNALPLLLDVAEAAMPFVDGYCHDDEEDREYCERCQLNAALEALKAGTNVLGDEK